MIVHSKDPQYQQCSLTVMDNIADPDITFDDNGICNYYHEYKQAEENLISNHPNANEQFIKIIEKIKENGKNKKYDCLIGLSGGVDSTYVAFLAKQYGLRPLAVHLDNGWNSELAVKNIENIINTLNIDLYTLVINWEEFKDIQLSYMKASVVDIEVVSDHAIFATMFKLAKEHNISCILSGTNVVTEYIMPPTWLYKKMDFANLKDIHDRYGKLKIKTYPTFNFRKYIYYSAFLKLTPISILDYVPYQKEQVKELIKNKLNWKDYGGKHHESIFTKFYQSYILPEKFHIDKRKAHLSTLICSGQITKSEALTELEKPIYSVQELINDKEYVLKKLGLTELKFKEIMALPRHSHLDYKSDTPLKEKYMNFLIKTAPFRRWLKSL